MADISISLSDDSKSWLDEQVRRGGYSSVGDYVADLVMKERIDQGEELSLEDVRSLVRMSRASGVGSKTMDELFSQAQRAAEEREARLA